MSRWEKRTLLLLPCVALVLFAAGDVAMSQYGLDPPYIYFEAGLWLKLASFAAALAAVAFAIFVGAKRYGRAKRKEPAKAGSQ